MEPRFVADAMLGKLARWLRMLGYDTLYNPSWDDPELVRLARAEDRILLTRDTALTRRRGVRVLFVPSERLDEQLLALHRLYAVMPQEERTRCSLCNELLEPVNKDQAWGLVPPYVFCTQPEFRLCSTCNRFYWRGSHWQHMQALIAAWAKGQSPR